MSLPLLLLLLLLLLQKTSDNLTSNQIAEILLKNHQRSIEKLQKYATYCSTFSLTYVDAYVTFILDLRPPTLHIC